MDESKESSEEPWKRPSLLSICTSSDGEIVHLHADEEGLKDLRRRIDELLSALGDGRVEHDHLFTEAWAGEELTATMLASEASKQYRVVHELTLHAWTAERAVQHGLTPGKTSGDD